MVLIWIKRGWPFFSCIILLGCWVEKDPQPKANLGYHMFQATEDWSLPKTLKEISAIASWNNGQLLALEDEHGILYLLNEKGEIQNQLTFAEDGDYEGLCLVEQELWVARSDGKLYQLKNWQKWEENMLSVAVYETALNNKNNVEGICYDPIHQGLLLACKGNPFLEGKNDKQFRAIYQFDLDKKRLYPKATFLIDLAKLENELWTEDNLLKIADFKPSDIAIHPQTREIYIPSATANLIVVLYEDGSLSKVYPLFPKIFEQVEGICFDLDANLYLSSEGKKAAARIWKFPYQALQ